MVSVGQTVFCVFLLLRGLLEVKGECSSPGISVRSELESNARTLYEEGEEITYRCKDSTDVMLPLNGRRRVCDRGKWSGVVPKCAQDVTSSVKLTSVDVSGLKTKRKVLKRCLLLEGKEIRAELKLQNISDAHYLELGLDSDQYQPETTIISISIETYNCTLISQRNEKKTLPPEDEANLVPAFLRSLVPSAEPMAQRLVAVRTLGFLCRKRVDVHFDTTSLVVHLNATKTFSLCEMRTFRFNLYNCGIPDVPLNSQVKVSPTYQRLEGYSFRNTFEALFTCSEGYQMVDDLYENPLEKRLLCCRNGTWIGSLESSCRPQISCDIPAEAGLARVRYQGATLWNQTLFATKGTTALFSCLESKLEGNDTLTCTESGYWSSHRPQCVERQRTITLFHGIIFVSFVVLVSLGVTAFVANKVSLKRIEKLREAKRRMERSDVTHDYEEVTDKNRYTDPAFGSMSRTHHVYNRPDGVIYEDIDAYEQVDMEYDDVRTHDSQIYDDVLVVGNLYRANPRLYDINENYYDDVRTTR